MSNVREFVILTALVVAGSLTVTFLTGGEIYWARYAYVLIFSFLSTLSIYLWTQSFLGDIVRMLVPGAILVPVSTFLLNENVRKFVDSNLRTTVPISVSLFLMHEETSWAGYAYVVTLLVFFNLSFCFGSQSFLRDLVIPIFVPLGISALVQMFLFDGGTAWVSYAWGFAIFMGISLPIQVWRFRANAFRT